MSFLDKFKRKKTETALLKALDKWLQQKQDSIDISKILLIQDDFQNQECAQDFACKYASKYLPKLSKLCRDEPDRIPETLLLLGRVFCAESAYKDEQQIEIFINCFEDIADNLNLSHWEVVSKLSFRMVNGHYSEGKTIPTAMNKDQYARLMTLHVKWDELHLIEKDHFYLSHWSYTHIPTHEDEDRLNLLNYLSHDLRFKNQLLKTTAKLNNPQGSEREFEYLCQAVRILPEQCVQPLQDKLDNAFQAFANNTLNTAMNTPKFEANLKSIFTRVSYANALGVKLNLGDIDIIHTAFVQDEHRVYDFGRIGGKVESDVKCYNDIYLFQFNRAAQVKDSALCIFKSDNNFSKPEEHIKPDFWSISSSEDARLIVTDDVDKALENEFGANSAKVSVALRRAALLRPQIK